MSDRLKEPWVCLSCRAHFTAGEIISKPASSDSWHCPKCDSTDINPADGKVTNVPEYFGEIGTRN